MGPGHAGVLAYPAADGTTKYAFSFHYYNGKTSGGVTMLGVREMTFSPDANDKPWPSLSSQWDPKDLPKPPATAVGSVAPTATAAPTTAAPPAAAPPAAAARPQEITDNSSPPSLANMQVIVLWMLVLGVYAACA